MSSEGYSSHESAEIASHCRDYRPAVTRHLIAFGLLACACTGTATQAVAQDIDPLRELSTDRPDKTESPYTVDTGRFQIELDLATYTIDREDGVRTETLGVAPFNIKYGLDDDTDLQVVVQPYVRQTVTEGDSGLREQIDGFGDVTLRLKRNLWGNDGGASALAVMPFVRLPTSRAGLGSSVVEFGVIVPLALSVAEGIGIGLMTELDFVEQSDGSGYAPSFVNSATIAFDLTDRLGLYTELFTERSIEDDARWVVTGDVGVTFALTDDIQLDAGMNVGLTDAADDLNVFVGISRRF